LHGRGLRGGVHGGDREAVRSALRELRQVGVAWPDGQLVRLVPPVLERLRRAKYGVGDRAACR
jgi:hypothetical protein